MNTTRNIAVIAAFISQGLFPSPVEANKVLDHYDGGCTELVYQACAHAEYLERVNIAGFAFQQALGHEIAGVYDYEVSEEFGAWFRKATLDLEPGHTPSEKTCRAKIVGLAVAFFGQDMTAPQVARLMKALERA